MEELGQVFKEKHFFLVFNCAEPSLQNITDNSLTVMQPIETVPSEMKYRQFNSLTTATSCESRPERLL